MTSPNLRDGDLAHVWHPFTPMLEYGREETPIIAAAEGFMLIDTQGRRYLDGISSLWCNVHGHRVPALDQAVRQQLDRVAHTTLLGLASMPSIELAGELAARAPRGLRHVFFSDNGSTAVEAALKIAFQYHQQRAGGARRDLFVTLGGAYHGDTIGSVSLGGIDLFHGIYQPLLFRAVRVPSPGATRWPKELTTAQYQAFCLAELERVLREHQQRIAAMIIEPLVQGAAGILVHPPGYLRRARQLTAELGIPLIADEVATGFGRTGTLFACEQEAVCPDVMCLAKGLTGGYLPLAATLATGEIYEAFLAEPEECKTFFHGHTYTGNPLGCAAALASLRLFDENRVLENARALEELLARRLRELANHPHVGDRRHKGLMVGIELVRDRSTQEPFAPRARAGHKVALRCRELGLIVRPLGDVMVLMPAPAMPAELVDQLCTGLFAAIDEVAARLARQAG